MAMLSSCTTLLSRAPPAPGKSCPGATALQLRSRQPSAASVARWASRKESRSRAALVACQAYNIEPSALVHPRAFESSEWSLKEEMSRIVLSFNVGVSTTDKDLEVATTEDQTLLVIRYKKKAEDKSSSNSPASSLDLDVRLLMPPGYDSNMMQAIMLNTGWLEIYIPKPKHEPKKIPITTSTKTQTNS